MGWLGLFPVILAMLGGCAAGTPWPDPLQSEAYADPQVVVATPGIEGGQLGLGGVWASRRAVYVDLVLDVPTTSTSDAVARAAQLEAYALDGSSRWFELESLYGRVELMRRVRSRSPLGTGTHEGRVSPRRLDGPAGRDRWAICAWYSTPERIVPGTYRLIVPASGEGASDMRTDLGLRQLDGEIVQVGAYSERPDVESGTVGTIKIP